MNKYKKLTSLIIALLMVLGMFPASTFSAFAEDEVYITEIALYPTEFTAYDHVDGVQTETGGGVSYYYYSPIFNDGDELRVAYSDESVVSYFYNSQESVFAAFDGKTIPLQDLDFISNQGEQSGSAKVTEWGIGVHSGEVSYMDSSCEVSIEVLANPVKSIEFKPTTFEIYEHSNGLWETKSFYYYDPRFRNGDTLTVKFTDGTSEIYTYYKDDECFLSDEGDEIMAEDVAFVSEQDDLLDTGKPCWGIGDHKGHFEYMGRKTGDVTVRIKASTVQNLKYTPAEIYEVVEKSGADGMWLRSDNGKEYFFYFLPNVAEGDTLELTAADGTKQKYVGEAYSGDDDRDYVRFVNTIDPSDIINGDKIFFCEEQDENPWTVGKNNYYWVEYQGIKSNRISATVSARGSTPKGRSATRVYGASRFETSLKIADAMKPSTNSKFEAVVLAYGYNYPDALAGSFLATYYEAPILLVDDANLEKVAKYVDSNLASSGTVYILGGEGAVSEKVETRIREKFKTIRLGGSTRYATNMEILKAGMHGKDLRGYTVFVCSGTGYADSLSASSTGQPILIVDPKNGLTDDQVQFLKDSCANDFIIAGGENAVPRKVETKLKQLGKVDRIGGATRYETSAMIAMYFASDGAPNAVVAYGEDFPDGLCAGPLAWVKDANLVLCHNNQTAEAQNYMDEYGIVKGYITGGPAVLSDAAVKSVFRCNSIAVFK